MPPRIRTKASKALKENIDSNNKLKNAKSNTKSSRKPLGDKTNSASDDTSVEVPNKQKVEVRPRRDRKLPARFEENSVLLNLCNKSIENVNVAPKSNTVKESKPINTVTSSKPNNTSIINVTPAKSTEPVSSPFKTPSKAETSLVVVSRPRRVCRLPSRFDDHFISPNKYIPIQPANASTPKQLNNAKSTINKENSDTETNNLSKKQTPVVQPTRTAVAQKKVNENVLSDKISPDTNNNAKTKTTRAKKTQPKPAPPKKVSPQLVNTSIRKFFNRTTTPQSSPVKNISPKPINGKRINVNNSSFKVLGDKKKSAESNENDLDIYEFTFDPDEEPQPQKKKRKRPVTKKPKVTKPKATVTHKSTYDQNISKALSALKKAVKPSKTAEPRLLPQIQEISDEVPSIVEENNVVTNNISNGNKTHTAAMNNTGKSSVHECNYASIRVEDIAADIEPSLDHCNDINYSPVNSPRTESPVATNPVVDPRHTPGRLQPSNDPLNLQEELSFFDDVPVASSSMNMSVRHPHASPWRVEFGNLPIKWHSNTYVKPNMTPAVESSFICSEDSNKKKHVYTNMVPETNESLPQIVSDTPNLKQTSIISFIKEVAERQAAKKKRGRSVSPSKATAIFDNIGSKTPTKNQVVESCSNKNLTPNKNTSEEVSASSKDISNDKENSKELRVTRKRKNNENISDRPAKSPRKQKDQNCTYFGFDDSENQDQENVSPVKVKDNARGRSLRSKRPVLQEINGPSRAALPLAAKTKTATSSEAVNRVYKELKSAADAPVFPEKNAEVNATNVEDPSFNEDSQSVHLFEDIELIHHLKPTRKSYGKAKKVTFVTRASSDSDTQEAPANLNDTSFEDDLGDLTFELPNVQEKKKYKKKSKKLMSKKEEKEAEEWAAGFNSMCEEVEEFPLVVE